jgi:hypothetical protein
MAKSIADITKDYTEFFRSLRDYLKLQGAQEYEPRQFQWFRPESVEDTTDLTQISSPFSTKELDEMAQTLVSEADLDTVNAGDYALIAMQHDAVVSANRAFASRHRSKLRHFAHANGIFDRLGGDYGTVHYAYVMFLTNLKRQAAQATK